MKCGGGKIQWKIKVGKITSMELCGCVFWVRIHFEDFIRRKSIGHCKCKSKELQLSAKKKEIHNLSD